MATELQIRQSMVSRAVSYLGAQKGGSLHADIIKTYNSIKPLPVGYAMKPTDNWCAAYGSAIAAKENNLDLVPAECSCPRQVKLWQEKGRWMETDSYTPKAGDYIYYDWDDNGSGDNKGNPDHVGIVTCVSDGTITVIEGNAGSPSQVKYRYIALNGRYIRGFGLPNYASKATKTSTPEKTVDAKYSASMITLSQGSNNIYVAALQHFLNGLGYSCGSADWSFGPKTKAAVIKFQAAKGLKQDGIVGNLTWTAIYEALASRSEVSYGSKGDIVGGIQCLLNAYGYNYSSVDNDFGSKTKKAVLRYQEARGLAEDGIVGRQTYKMLFKGK